MEKQMLSLLNAFYYNAALGADAIRGILSKAKNEHFKLTLYRQLQYYQQQKDQLTQQIQGLYDVPTEVPAQLQIQGQKILEHEQAFVNELKPFL